MHSRIVIFVWGLALAYVPTAFAQGFIFPEPEDNPALRACGGHLLDPGKSMTASERAEAQRLFENCIRDFRAKQPPVNLHLEPALPQIDEDERRHQQLLDAIRSKQ